MRVPSALQAGRAGTLIQRLIPTRVPDPLIRTLKTCFINYFTYNNLTPIPTLKWRLPTLLNTNTRSIVHKIDEMTKIIDDNEVDIACVTETWLSDEVPHCVTDIVRYTCERRDRVDGRGGASLLTSVIAFHITIYLFLNATRWSHYGYWWEISACREIFIKFWLTLCINIPGACKLICTNHIISSIGEIMKKHP